MEECLGDEVYAEFDSKNEELILTADSRGDRNEFVERVYLESEVLENLIRFIMRIKNYEATRIKVTDEFSEKQ